MKLRMKFHFNFQYKLHIKCVSHYTYLHKKCFYCVWFLQCESIIINDEYFSSKADGIKKDFSVFVNNSSREISTEITNEISLQLPLQILHAMCLTLHISSQKVLPLCLIPPMWKYYNNDQCFSRKADGIKKDFSDFVYNSSHEILNDITNEISLQLSIQISPAMCLTLHISSQKVLLLCLIPPMWKYYYQWWVFSGKADGIKKDFSLFVNNSSREISSEITNEISLQLSIQISHAMCLTLHISSQKVLLFCLIPPMWKYYYQWWVC